MPWLRLWVDILDDPDLDALPNDTCWAWTRMLAVAKRNDPQGQLPSGRRLAVILREDETTVARYINELIGAGLIDEIGGSLHMHGWEKWQPKEPMSNAERQAKFRQTKKVSSLDSPSKEKSNRGEEKSNVTPLLSVTRVTPPPSVTASPTESEADRVCNLAAEIGGDIGWATWAETRLRMKDSPKAIEFALSEAVNAKVISTAFCGKVLARIAREGMPKAPPSRNGRAGVEPAINQPASAMNPPPGLEVFKAESDALMAKYEQQQEAKRRKTS